MSDSPTEPTAPSSEPAASTQRILMERARQQAERAQEKLPRRPGQVLASIVFALIVVAVIGGAINAFLAAMQRTMQVMDEQEKAEEARREAAKLKEPLPTYVVPDEQDPQKK